MLSTTVSFEADERFVLARACREAGIERRNRTAFVFEGKPVSFAEVNDRSERLASWLIGQGVQAGDRVAILAKDSVASYELLFAVVKAKAVLVPINWRCSAAEVAFIVSDSAAKFLFVGTEFADRMESVRQVAPEIREVMLGGSGSGIGEFARIVETASGRAEGVEYHEEDPVVQIYTSGTTGNPKGVVLANRTFFRLLHGMRQRGDLWMDLNPDDRLLLSLPQFHIGGLWWAVQGFLAGATGYLIDQFRPVQVLETIARNRLTKVPLVPAMIQFVLAEPSARTTDLSSVQAVLYGGSPISPGLLERAMDLFRCDFFQIYGLTETGNMAVCLRPADHVRGDERLLAAGKPLPGVEAKVVDTDGRETGPGQVGEILLKSPSRMLSYHGSLESTAATMTEDGWIRTGDAGYRDSDGYLFVQDRIKDLIIYACKNISPAAVEAVLCRHPEIAEAAVVGAPDERWGEIVTAFVVTRPGETLKTKELMQFIRGQVADFEIPRSIRFVDSLPRNPSGKILKRELRAPLWAGRERLVN